MVMCGGELVVKASVRGMIEGWGSGLVGREELNSKNYVTLFFNFT